MAFTNGFTVLAWGRPDSSLLTRGSSEISEENKARLERQLLLDFCCLLGIRWNMDVTIHMIEGCQYAFGKNVRFGVSDRTLRNALGTLFNHVDFIRGSPENTAEDLARFKVCKEKWNVPDQITESASGWDPQEPAGTSTPIKRKRY